MRKKETKLAPVVSVAAGDSSQRRRPVWYVPTGAGGYIEIRNDYWSATFGICQEELSQINIPSTLIVDFSKICWIDPLPLLGIFIAIKTCCVRTGSCLMLLLGDEPVSHDIMARGGFLKFVSQHGFLSTLIDVPTEIVLGKTSYTPEKRDLHAKLSTSMYIMAYPDSLCLDAMIIPIASFQQEDNVSATTSKWINTVKESRINGYFEGEQDLFDEFIDKVHILLVEIMLNAGEHAHDPKEDLSECFVGIYARLRASDGQETKLWLRKNNFISAEKECCPGFSGFHLSSKHSTWLEIFYLDQGRGLLADLELWKKKSKGKLCGKLSEILANLKPTTNKLHEVGKLLFQEPLSRHDREKRTVLTGLQYVRHALSDKEDCTGVYTAGEWLGARLPWSPDTIEKSINIAKQNKYIAQDNRVHFTAGTAWHFCLDLDHVMSIENAQGLSGWDHITSNDVDSGKQGKTQYRDWQVFDDRDLGGGIKSRPWRDEKFSTKSSFYLWIPALVRKNLVYQWFHSILRYKGKQLGEEWVWIIADLSRKDASLMEAVLSSAEYNGKRHNVLVYLLTRDWCIKCFRSVASEISGRLFEKDVKQTRLAKKNGGTFIFNMLREHDSKIFWEGLPGEGAGRSDSAFISEEIIWERDENNRPSIILYGYLDLTQALLDPKRLAVARRALERVWYLHANKAECVAADPLLTNLLPREARLGLNDLQDNNRRQATPQVVMSSVYVTGNTSEQEKKAGQSAIHLLRHTQVQGLDFPSISSLYALNWIQSPVEMVARPENFLPYERIPGTPYISRGGAKAAPIRRFDFDKDSNFFVKSFYGKNPQETYNELISFGLLKLGHWVYGSHHDLLTLNLGGCVERKKFYKDTAIEWIFRQLEGFKKQANVDRFKIVVVYMSHSVTEKMVNALKGLASERGAQIPIFIPVHFLAPHSQTAIRIPSLTYERIRHELRDDQQTEERKVVLLDDGAVTGKVQREMAQLLRNAGAREVIHVGIVTRTGLPLYRKYLSGPYSEKHLYYWRWDVPPLGNARTCPLCRAIDHARELARHMWIEDAANEVNEWVRTWKANFVTTHWRRHGLSPGKLPDVRPVTFGKEWLPGKEPIKYQIKHITSTGLAATVMEIIRTTSYKDVGLKRTRDPWGDNYKGDKTKWRDAKLEILICQLLIYLDDFTEQEVQERFRLLLEVLLEPETGWPTPARTRKLECLGCLTLLLANERQVKFITRQLWKLLEGTQDPGGHLLLIVGVLMRRAGNFHEQIKAIPSKELDVGTEVKIKALLSAAHFYGLGEEIKGTRHAIFSLILLLGENDTRNHTGFLRKKLIGDLHTDKQDLARDLKTLEQSLREIDLHVLSDTTPTSFDPQGHANTMRQFINKIENGNVELNMLEQEEICPSIFNSPMSLAASFRDNFILTVNKIHFFLTTAITKKKWEEKVKKYSKSKVERWKAQGSIVLPDVDVSMKNINNPSEVYVVFPPIARKMLRDYLFNVVHSSRRIQDNGLNCDISCSLDINEDILFISMWNYTKEEGFPQKKPAEGVVSAQLIKDPANYNLSDGKMTINVKLPLVQHLCRSEK